MNLEKIKHSAKPLKLGVLDMCACYPGVNPQDALRRSIVMAQRTEQLGYTRYWFSEHHNPEIAHSCPEIMTAVICGATNTIRVGSACVLLRHYNSYKIASTFRLLNTLYPSRIDLGVGRGLAGALPLGVLPQSDDTYEVQIANLVKFARSAKPALPVNVPAPEVWLHGTGCSSVPVAAEAGTCFSLGLFLNFKGNGDHRAIIERYRADFKPSEELTVPRCNVAVAGICAETEERAKRLLAHHRGTISVVPTVVGNPRQCKDEFERLRCECGVDEIIFLDLSTRLEDRLQSYGLLAAEIGLTPSAEPESTKKPKVLCSR